MNIPNIVTFSRIGLIPVFMIVYYLPFKYAHVAATVIFAIACVTDLLDGYLARSLKQTSPLGSFLDPVADKLLITTAIVLVLGHSRMEYLTLPSVIIVAREVVVSALREWMAEIGKRASVAVNLFGKVKTILQMFAVGALVFISKDSAAWQYAVAYVSYYAAAALTLWSMIVYFKAAWPMLKPESAQEIKK